MTTGSRERQYRVSQFVVLRYQARAYLDPRNSSTLYHCKFNEYISEHYESPEVEALTGGDTPCFASGYSQQNLTEQIIAVRSTKPAHQIEKLHLSYAHL